MTRVYRRQTEQKSLIHARTAAGFVPEPSTSPFWQSAAVARSGWFRPKNGVSGKLPL